MISNQYFCTSQEFPGKSLIVYIGITYPVVFKERKNVLENKRTTVSTKV